MTTISSILKFSAFYSNKNLFDVITKPTKTLLSRFNEKIKYIL